MYTLLSLQTYEVCIHTHVQYVFVCLFLFSCVYKGSLLSCLQATDELMRILKLESDDRDMSALLEAAKAVSDASSKLLNTAKVSTHWHAPGVSCRHSSCVYMCGTCEFFIHTYTILMFSPFLLEKKGVPS